jgi:peptidyl-prolyl cis-trans isomerase B (cyclophilin B)
MHTNFGTIVLELKPEQAPKTVDNFLRYVKEGFYDGTVFHRVIRGFVIQGGGYTQDYEKKSTHPSIPNESENGLENLRFTIAMARGSYDPDSATSQFFINVNNNSSLNYQSSPYSDEGYTVFGQVIKGMEVVDKIQKARTSAAGPFRRYVPKKHVVIESVMFQNAPVKPLAQNALSDDEPVATEIAILPKIQENEKETLKASEMLTDSTVEIKTAEEEKTLVDNSNSSSTAVSIDETQEDTPVLAETENYQASQDDAVETSETITADKTLAKSSSSTSTEDKPSGIFKKTETFKAPKESYIETIPLGEKTLTDNSQARLAYVTEMEEDTPSAALAEKEKSQALQLSRAYPLKTSFSAPDSPSTPDQPEPLSD